MTGTITHLGQVFDETDLRVLDDIWHRWGFHRMRSHPAGSDPIGPLAFASAIGSRADAARNFARTGGRFGSRDEVPEVLNARGAYFREEYAYGDEIFASGIERVLRSERLSAVAEQLYGLPVVLPWISYGNLLVPGQELGLHTDVPAFRGADRTVVPLWLLVVMHHSRLFDRWRIPIATAVAYVGDCAGGTFAYYADGPDGPAAMLRPEAGTAVVFDGDTVFHGVDRVGGDDSGIRSVRGGRMLVSCLPDRTWELATGIGGASQRKFRYAGDELRYSVSWKAYCFADEADVTRWRSHSDDLDPALVKDALVGELYRRGALSQPVETLADRELALLMIDTFVRFPVPEAI